MNELCILIVPSYYSKKKISAGRDMPQLNRQFLVLNKGDYQFYQLTFGEIYSI